MSPVLSSYGSPWSLCHSFCWPNPPIFLIFLCLKLFHGNSQTDWRKKLVIFLNLIDQKTSGVVGSRSLQDSITDMFSYLCTFSRSLSFSVFISWYFLFILFYLNKHFPCGNILGHQQLQDYLIPDQKSIFAKNPRNSPREDLKWTNLTFSRGSLWFSSYRPCSLSLPFSPQLSLCLPLPLLKFPFFFLGSFQHKEIEQDHI